MNASIFILGPTASGKHTLAVAVAERLGAEIVSIDSMKVYREMDIGTAKPSPEDQARVRHHLIDILDPSETYSAARFVADGHRRENEIRQSGKVPLYVGGTALYYKALTRGLFVGPDADPALRAELEEIAATKGVAHLHAELSKVDPVAAGRIHPNDLRRIVRALEVYRKTSTPISVLQTQFERPVSGGAVVFVLHREREDLRKRIDDRVRRMLKNGLIEEVERLRARSGGWSRETRSAVGYREIEAYLDGAIDRDEAERAIVVDTWRFAKRQMMWFRSFPEARRLAVSAGESLTQVMELLLAKIV